MTQEQDWRDGRPIVWMSVQETARRLGVTTSVVNDNEKALVRLGAVCFDDSGNYRRWGKRDERGRIIEAYGINLSPLAALRDHLHDMEEMVTGERLAWRRAKSAYSAVRRYVSRLVVSEQSSGGSLEGARAEFEALVANMKSRPNTSLDDYQGCQQIGITATLREDHAIYIADWVRVLKNDPKALFKAAAAAEKAADYLLAPNRLWVCDFAYVTSHM